MGKNLFKLKAVFSVVAASMISPVLAGETNSVVQETVEENLVASNSLKSRLDSKAIKMNEDILQIQVLDQRKTKFGEEACGYHSWKNALLSLAIVETKENKDVKTFRSLFDDKEFYNDVIVEFFYPKNSIPKGDKDLSIVEANKAYKRLLTEKIENENLKKIASLLKNNPSSISFLNPTNEMLFGGLEESSLSNIETFYKAVTKPGQSIHAIVFGKFPHWTTLLMEIDDLGTITWYGCDSYGNQTEELPENKAILEKYIKNISKLDEQVLIGYNEAIGFDLSNKANWLKKGDTESLLQSIKPVEIKNGNFNSDSLNINSIPKRIVLAFDFLNRMDLFKNEGFKEHLENIKNLADFYTKNLKEEHSSSAKMKEISEFFKKLKENKILDI